MAKKAKTSSFRNKVAKDTQRQKTAGSNYGYLILPKGVGVLKTDEVNKLMIDILPYVVSDAKHPDLDQETDTATVGSLWYKRPFKIHRNIGSGNDTVVCLSSVGGRCPICEFRTKRIKEGAEKEELDALKASQRNLYVVIPKGVKGMEETPHIWDVSQYLFQNLLNDELEENDENAVFPDLEEGKTLKIRFEEKQLGKNKFKEVSRIDFVDRDEAYDEAILNDIPDLDKVLTILSYKELEAKFMELDPVEDEDDDEPVKSKKGDIRRKTKPSKEEVEEDEDEDDTPPPPKKRKPAPVVEEDDEEDEDEDDAPPPPPTKKRKPVPVPVEDDEDDDEDDTPPPPKKKKPAPAPAPPVKGKKNKCPHGYKFGVDTEEYAECDDCPIWDACIEAKEDGTN